MKVLSTENNFLAIEEEASRYDTSEILIVSAPYEHSVSYGAGTASGPAAALESSGYVEFYDDEFDRELCYDKGIATAEPIDFGDKVDADALKLIYDQVKSGLDDGKFVVTVGGEHTISTAPIKAHIEKYPKMSVLHFDAHSDLRDEYEGSKYSHASVFARVIEFLAPERLTQVGIRAQCIEESRLIKERGVNTFYASAIRRGIHGENWVEKLVATLAPEVYVSFDVDFFDPAVMPATGTPEPDGFGYNEALTIFREMQRQGKRIIGFDVVELAPIDGLTYPDITTSRLIYKMLNFAFEGK